MAAGGDTAPPSPTPLTPSGLRGEVRLIVAPERCYEPPVITSGKRVWGIAVQLYSLRRGGDGGYGDYTALREVVRRAAERGASAVAISPVHAMFSADVLRAAKSGNHVGDRYLGAELSSQAPHRRHSRP